MYELLQKGQQQCACGRGWRQRLCQLLRRRQRRRRHIASSSGAASHRGHKPGSTSHTHKRGHGAAQEPRERKPGASASAEGRKGTLPLSDQRKTPIPLISWCGRLFSGGLATSPNAFFHAGGGPPPPALLPLSNAAVRSIWRSASATSVQNDASHRQTPSARRLNSPSAWAACAWCCRAAGQATAGPRCPPRSRRCGAPPSGTLGRSCGARCVS